jgi:hypothetical protein
LFLSHLIRFMHGIDTEIYFLGSLHFANGDKNSYSSPVLADVDGDNLGEVMFCTL